MKINHMLFTKQYQISDDMNEDKKAMACNLWVSRLLNQNNLN